MTWYATEPQNMTAAQVDQRIVEAVRRQGLPYSPRSIPQIALDVPIVSALPREAPDGTEVHLRVERNGIDRYIYLRSVPGWVRMNDTVPQSIVTALPTDDLYEGLQVVYDTGTAGVRWHLVYDTSDGTTYPWLVIGGSPLRATNVGTSMAAPTTNYGDTSTAGPSLTIPLAGEYRVQHWFQGQGDTVGAVLWGAVKIGAAATADLNGVRGQVPVANHDVKAPVGDQDITVTAAATVLKVQYKLNAGTGTINNHGGLNPWITAMPRRVA